VGDDVGRVLEDAADLLEAVAVAVEGALIVVGEAESRDGVGRLDAGGRS
jgi:hypothetical protein